MVYAWAVYFLDLKPLYDLSIILSTKHSRPTSHFSVVIVIILYPTLSLSTLELVWSLKPEAELIQLNCVEQSNFNKFFFFCFLFGSAEEMRMSNLQHHLFEVRLWHKIVGCDFKKKKKKVYPVSTLETSFFFFPFSLVDWLCSCLSSHEPYHMIPASFGMQGLRI